MHGEGNRPQPFPSPAGMKKKKGQETPYTEGLKLHSQVLNLILGEMGLFPTVLVLGTSPLVVFCNLYSIFLFPFSKFCSSNPNSEFCSTF